MSNPVRELLAQATVQQLVGVHSSEVVSLQETDTLSVALDLFAKHKILSAPVLDRDGTILGIVDNIDTLRKIAEYLDAANQFESLRHVNFETVTLDVQVKTLINPAKGDALLSVAGSTSVEDVLKFFASGLAHRCIVNFRKDAAGDEKTDKPAIFSQSDLLRFLSKQIGLAESSSTNASLIAFVDKDVLDLVPKIRELVTVDSTTSVLETVRTMTSKNVSAVAVVDASGKLVGNFSASDLRGLKFTDFPRLLETVGNFLSDKSKDPKVVYESTSLKNVIHTLADHKIHRVWQVDLEGKPVGIISITDVLKAVYNNNVV